MARTILSIFIITIVSVLMHMLNRFGIFKNQTIIYGKYHDCKYVDKYIPGPEDITSYNSTTLIFGSAEFFKIFEIGDPLLAARGNIYAILDAQINPKFIELELIGFPIEIAFNPHGLYIYEQHNDKYLYVINHAYQKGAERVEIFKFTQDSNQLQLKYIKGIIFDKQFNGVLNDLIVINQTNLIITQYLKYPDPLSGRKDSSKSLNLLYQVLQIKATYAWSCIHQTDEIIAQCTAIQSTKSIMNNGITKDKDDNVFIADPMLNSIRIFKYDKNNDEVLTYLDTLYLDGGPDNVEYDAIENKLYVGVIYRLIDHLKVIEFGKQQNGVFTGSENLGVFSEAVEIDLNSTSENYMKSVTIHRDNKANIATSSSYQRGNFLYLGSWADKSINYCKLKN